MPRPGARTWFQRPRARDVRRLCAERGTGVLSTMAAVSAFLLFLLFAVQLLVNLTTVSTVSAAGYDAARTVAARQVDHDDAGSVAAAQARAEARYRAVMGRAGNHSILTWSVSPTEVRLQVVTTPPGILPSSLGHHLAFSRIERSFLVRVEDLQ